VDCFVVTDVDVRCLVTVAPPDAWYVPLVEVSARFAWMSAVAMDEQLVTGAWYLTNCRALAEAVQAAGARWQWWDRQGEGGARIYG
jgi:hypothetical protein